jgi:heterodisulfide reductase subunit C/nitrate reductase gamma subunit
MDFFNTTLIIAIVFCAAGLVYRFADWFALQVESRTHESTFQRLGAGLRATARTLFSPRILGVLKGLVLDGLLQFDLLRRSPLRWAMHFAIFAGFVLLVLFHAMDGVLSYGVLPGYEPTLDPYQILRNVLGALVLAGVAVAAWRRMKKRRLARVSGRRDWFAIWLVLIIVGSGFLLEAAKMVSPRAFDRMNEQYALLEGEEYEALRLYWAEEYGTYYPGAPADPDGELYALGEELDYDMCASCHSPTSTAFVSYALARAIQPVGWIVSFFNLALLFWYLHVLATFFGLAALPWTKFLHIVTTPLNFALHPRTVRPTDDRPAGPEREPARILGMDACTHCGQCSLHCSVAPSHTILGVADILPSEKLASLQGVMRGRLDEKAMWEFTEGSFICTECHRCTDVCPSRIDLQDLWLASKKDLLERQRTEPHLIIPRKTAGEWARLFRGRVPMPAPPPGSLGLADEAKSFWACVQCTTCTSVCPVVGASNDPAGNLDLTPQQIMNLLRMRRKDLTLGARMVWSCVTCYKCQEHCPQNIKVADILYELRQLAAAGLRESGRDVVERENP